MSAQVATGPESRSRHLDVRDRDATEPRLVNWALERGMRSLPVEANLVELQRNPGTEAALVERLRVTLTHSILQTHEFEGSEQARATGAEALAGRWAADVGPTLEQHVTSWLEGEYIDAVGRTPEGAELVSRSAEYRRVRDQKFRHRLKVGRWWAVATVGSRWGNLVIEDIYNAGYATVWFSVPGEPAWYYCMSGDTFIRSDPFVTEVARQVADKTQFAQELLPVLLTVAGFTLGLHARLAFVIAGIALEELAEEMRREARDQPGRATSEVFGSMVQNLVIDRIFGKVFDAAGAAGRAGRATPEIERIVDRAVPAVRREIVATEAPTVATALQRGQGRPVTDPALRSRGYVTEVEVVVEGRRHTYRQRADGTWCRSSQTICELDLGSEVAEAAKSPTERRLESVHERIDTVEGEIDFLQRIHDRMRAHGRMDLRLLEPHERELLDDLAPTGDAGDLTLSGLRDLRREGIAERGLEYRALEAEERRLIDQLRREARPLYDLMRAASPRAALRRRVWTESRGLDAVTDASPRSGALQVDHVVPLKTITDMPGFRDLHFDDQLAIVNDPHILRAVDRRANTSRQDWSWAEWPQARLHYDESSLRRIRALEEELTDYVRARIASSRRR